LEVEPSLSALIGKKHSKNSFDMGVGGGSPSPAPRGGVDVDLEEPEEESALLGEATGDSRGGDVGADVDVDVDLSAGHSKQHFFAAFLQSSIPQDVWEDIRNVNWKVEHTPPSAAMQSATGEGDEVGGDGEKDADVEAARSLEMSLLTAGALGESGDATATATTIATTAANAKVIQTPEKTTIKV
jgi:hypothetical protein